MLNVDVGVRQWTALGISGDSRKLVVTNEPSGTITLVNSTADQWLESACKTAGRHFSQEEWQAITGRSAMAEQAC
jgi:hypothetical protein